MSHGRRLSEVDEDEEELYVPVKVRRLQEAQTIAKSAATSNSKSEKREIDVTTSEQRNAPRPTLVETVMQGSGPSDYEDPIKQMEDEEKELLKAVQRSMNTPLLSVQERAHGIKHGALCDTGWSVPKKYEEELMIGDRLSRLRNHLYIDVQGNNVPPLITKFEHLRLPKAILEVLEKKNIRTPTQIQMQGLPCALLGRDMIGIAFTGSGKTIVFVIPAVMLALDAELRLPLIRGEGPIGLIVCPSRELASQATTTIQEFADALYTTNGYPLIRVLLMIGGVSVSEQLNKLKEGVHLVVATPGRLNDMLNKRKMHLQQCRYLVMDEADRLIDLGFEEEIRSVFDHFSGERQILLFSATMPRKILEFATTALVDPVVVNVGRAGAANLDVVQEVEYVKQEEKLPYLLNCLHKTKPPVVIFCESKKDVDVLHEYLLLKNVEAVAIHGGLSQEERLEAVNEFRAMKKDVLVGTDVASKGLDFAEIKHVINFDMPREIENYVHRIGRTGRCGKLGIATTFVNKTQDPSTLLDLRALLIEAGQRVPPFLEHLHDRRAGLDAHEEIGGVRGCAYCGGLGHRIAECPKLESQKSKNTGASSRDMLTTRSRYGGTAAYGGDW